MADNLKRVIRVSDFGEDNKFEVITHGDFNILDALHVKGAERALIFALSIQRTFKNMLGFEMTIKNDTGEEMPVVVI